MTFKNGYILIFTYFLLNICFIQTLTGAELANIDAKLKNINYDLTANLDTNSSANLLAVNRKVPDSKQQINLSFAPIVKKTAPAVVNIYTKKKVQISGI